MQKVKTIFLQILSAYEEMVSEDINVLRTLFLLNDHRDDLGGDSGRVNSGVYKGGKSGGKNGRGGGVKNQVGKLGVIGGLGGIEDSEMKLEKV